MKTLAPQGCFLGPGPLRHLVLGMLVRTRDFDASACTEAGPEAEANQWIQHAALLLVCGEDYG